MLKETTLSELAKRAGCSLAQLKYAIKSDSESDLSFEDEGAFISDIDLEKIKERARKDSHKEGKKSGEEMLIKTIKDEEELSFDGTTKDQLIKALKEKISKSVGKEPSAKITELETDNRKLKELVNEAEAKLMNETKNFAARLNGIEIENKIKAALPDKLANGLTRDQAYRLYKSDRDFTKIDSGIALVDPITKEIIKDKKLNPISVIDDLKNFIESFGTAATAGRGDGDTNTKSRTNIESFTKRTDVEAYFEKNNIPLSDRGGILQKAMKNEGFNIRE